MNKKHKKSTKLSILWKTAKDIYTHFSFNALFTDGYLAYNTNITSLSFLIGLFVFSYGMFNKLSLHSPLNFDVTSLSFQSCPEFFKLLD